jgi:hypothetical protein
MRAIAAMLVLPWVCAATAAHAEGSATGVVDPAPSPRTDPPTPPSREPRWYGGPILLIDLGAGILAGAAAATSSEGLGVTAALSYVALPALVHGANGEGGHAAASVGLRVTLPATGALLGYGIGHHPDQACPQRAPQPGQYNFNFCFNLNLSGLVEGFIGGLLGVITASMVDALGLAYTRDRSPSLALGVRPTPGGSVLVIGGAL